MIKSIKSLAVFIFAVFLAASCGSKEEKKTVSYQEAIETASFVTLDGERVSVSDFKGKIVLVDFWETWCVPCLNVMPTFQQILEEYPEDFVVLAVSPGWSDEPEDIRRFAEQHGYEFIWVTDPDGVSATLGISGIPYKIFLAKDGTYLTTEVGSGGHQREYSKIVGIIEEQLLLSQM